MKLLGSRADGFTLLELIVAISVLGLLFAMLAGGLRFGVVAWEKGGDVATRTAELQTAQRVLRRQIEQMRPIIEPERRREGELAVIGAPTALRFVGPPPAQLGLPGLYHLRVAIDGSVGARSLVLSWRRLQPDISDFAEPTQDAESSVLIQGIKDGTFAYFGRTRPQDPPAWRDRWIDRKELPLLVRIQLRYRSDDGRHWPALMIAPRVQSMQ